MSKQNDEPKDSTITFLMAEYSELNEELKRQRDSRLRRLNFFVTITSSVLGGLIIVSGFGSITTVQFHFISLGALFFLLLIGWGTFRYSVERDIKTDEHIRAIARIRHYFVELDPIIKEHLTWQDNDEPTHYIWGRASTIRTTAHVIVSVLCALTVGLIMNLVIKNLPILLAIGLVIFVVAFFGLDNYIKRRFQAAQSDARRAVRFPDDEKNSTPSDYGAESKLSE